MGRRIWREDRRTGCRQIAIIAIQFTSQMVRKVGKEQHFIIIIIVHFSLALSVTLSVLSGLWCMHGVSYSIPVLVLPHFCTGCLAAVKPRQRSLFHRAFRGHLAAIKHAVSPRI